jgi:hypothetical protein
MNRESWWGRQLQREDLITTLEQGRRVEVELFQEKHRGLRTMGELLKSRMFGATEWAISLRKRMTKFQGGVEDLRSSRPDTPSRPSVGHLGSSGYIKMLPNRPPEPHSWPCDDPFCQPCEDGVKRLLRDVGVLPRKGRARK